MKPAKISQIVNVPLENSKADFICFDGLQDAGEHFAVGFGDWKSQSNPLVRIHSECATGDLFGSRKCDCGNQLQEATATMSQQGGLILYLRQEGRGIGLTNKLKAYALQAQGLDTLEANRALGLPEDARDYTIAVQMLKALGKSQICLLSNNPLKTRALREAGIEIICSKPTQTYLKTENRNYLLTKKLFCAHSLGVTV